MTYPALMLIFCSVLLHALWHFICKSRNPHLGFFVVFSFAILCTMLPLMLFSGIRPAAIPPAVWLCAAAGGVSGMVCDIGLGYAYRNSDISLAYPMARALPVLFTACVTQCLGIGKELSLPVLAAMGVIFLGCALLPLPDWRKIRLRSYCSKGMFGVLLAAVGTTCYTIADGCGVPRMAAAAPDCPVLLAAGCYSFWREAAAFVALNLGAVLLPGERAYYTRDLWRQLQPYLAGMFAGCAYVLVLWAMKYVTNVSYVQAFRQISLPIGVVLGVVFLKERLSLQKIAAILMILGGLGAVSLL